MDRYFEFDGQKSVDMGYHVVYFSKDYFDRLTYGGRDIKSMKNGQPRIEDKELIFKITVAKMDIKDNLIPFKQDDIRKLAKWLIQSEYKPMRFSNEIDKIYYVMLRNMSELNLDRAENGFLDLEFISYTNHAYTNTRIDRTFIDKEGMVEIFAEHLFEKEYYPSLTIRASEDCDISIRNLSTGQLVKIDNVKEGDVISLDNKIKHIEIDDPHRSVFKDFNREWLWYRYGLNMLQIKGSGVFEFYAQYPIL